VPRRDQRYNLCWRRFQIIQCKISTALPLTTCLPNYPIRPGEHMPRNPNDSGFSISGFGLFAHRITLSALARTLGGMLSPICFAVFRLTRNLNFVGC
jgi:hypothetical protein